MTSFDYVKLPSWHETSIQQSQTGVGTIENPKPETLNPRQEVPDMYLSIGGGGCRHVMWGKKLFFFLEGA